MRLTRKLTIALTCAILLVLGVNAAVRIHLELSLFEQDVQRDSRLLGRTIGGAAARIWQRSGEAEALDLVADANERESHVMLRWVWLDAEDGDPYAPELPIASLVKADGDGISVRWIHEEDGVESLYTYMPTRVPDPRRGAIELREPLDDIEAVYVQQTVVQVLLTTSLLVAVSAIVALGLGAVLVGRPVRSLVEQARRIGAGDLGTRIEVHQRDEIGELATEMNAMSNRLQQARDQVERETSARLTAVEQLRHADRLTTVGKLAAGIAHEVGTPLNVITGYAQLITDEYPSDSPAHEHAVIVSQQAHRVAGIIRQLLDFARPRAPRKVSEDVVALAHQALAMLQSMAHRRGVKVSVTAVDEVRAAVDPGQLQQALTNLVVNAIQAMPAGGDLTIAIARREAAPPGDVMRECVSIAVSDSGPGIAPEVLARLFEPFFTTKDPGEGTGLGLPVTYGIIKEHGGWIDVTTELGRGSTFTVYLPTEIVS